MRNPSHTIGSLGDDPSWAQTLNHLCSGAETRVKKSPDSSPAAAAKLLQLCLTLCDPIDGSPLGSSVPGILQERILEWVAISFSNAWKWKVKVKSLSRVWLFATPWTVVYQAPPSMGFSGKSTGVGCHFLLHQIVLGPSHLSLPSWGHRHSATETSHPQCAHLNPWSTGSTSKITWLSFHTTKSGGWFIM